MNQGERDSKLWQFVMFEYATHTLGHDEFSATNLFFGGVEVDKYGRKEKVTMEKLLLVTKKNKQIIDL